MPDIPCTLGLPKVRTGLLSEDIIHACYWRRSEDDLLRTRYRELGAKRLARLLPGRSITAIRMRASKLRIATPRNRQAEGGAA